MCSLEYRVYANGWDNEVAPAVSSCSVMGWAESPASCAVDFGKQPNIDFHHMDTKPWRHFSKYLLSVYIYC